MNSIQLESKESTKWFLVALLDPDGIFIYDCFFEAVSKWLISEWIWFDAIFYIFLLVLNILSFSIFSFNPF